MSATRGRGRALYLVRHGSTPCNEAGRLCGEEEVSLSDLGRRQVGEAAEHLAGCRVDLVLSSPYLRTLETARALAAPHGLEPETDGDLAELRLGSWSGQDRAELRSRDPSFVAWLETPHLVATPAGERLVDVERRGRAALARGLARVEPGGGLVCVTHGGVVRVLLLSLLGLPLASYQRVRADPGSVSALVVDGDGALEVLLGLNLGDPRRALRAGPPA